jgi:hypothetical protein
MVFPEEAMAENDQDNSTSRLAGYAAVIERYNLDIIPNWHESMATASGIHRMDSVETLFCFIEQTIDTELTGELAFLANYDKTKKAIQEIVDMPDRQIDIFIRFCLQNKGSLSARKPVSHFDTLSDEKIYHMEQSVQSTYGITAASGVMCEG